MAEKKKPRSEAAPEFSGVAKTSKKSGAAGAGSSRALGERVSGVGTLAKVPERGPLARIFGVRHLSPAGALYLRRFIEQVEPTAILIEGPSDATSLIEHLAHKKTKPPVALFAFTKTRPVRSILYPLASYSPEWVALTVGLRRGCLVRFMDLPAETFLAMHEHGDQESTDEDNGALASEETRAYLDDPFEEIARISGDPDHETFWEKHFEQAGNEAVYREAIDEFAAVMREVRRDPPWRERETLTREAFMRRVIVDTIREGHDPERIVVVCGAFHSPALVGEAAPMTPAEVEALPRVPTTLTLMPYSYYRLSAQSGYGAGNHAPNYYQMVWEAHEGGSASRVGPRYLAEIAGRMRTAGMVRSSAEVIEAVRLANALAAMGGSSAPTLRDLRDAAVTCLAGGDRASIEKHLVEVEVGDAIGTLPPGVSRTSIQEDFHRWVKDLRLEDYLKDKEQPVKGRSGDPWLDRRLNRFVKSEDAAARDRRRSVFFHRLEALGVGFATRVADDEEDKNSFKERWVARWKPECEINLVENALRGDTIETAAAQALAEKILAAESVGEATSLALQAVDCDLPEVVDRARRRVQALAVDDAGFTSIAAGVRNLASLVRYKHQQITSVDVEPVKPLVAQLFLRATLLVGAAARCDDAAARGKAMPGTVQGVKGGIEDVEVVAGYADEWGDALPVARWHAALNDVADDDLANPYVSGAVCALLLESGCCSDDVLEQRVARRLSPGTDPVAGAGFFEGLASRNHMALLGRKRLWQSMTEFIEGLDVADFKKALVGLRRAFASFEMGEVRRVASTLAEIWGGGANEIARAVETRLDETDIETLKGELEGLGDLDF